MSYMKEFERIFGINLLALFKLEYRESSGRFDSQRYTQALKNYYDTIDELKIPPPKEFLMLGVEHLHELGDNAREMLIHLARRREELEVEELGRFLKAITRLPDELKRISVEKG